MNRAYMFFLILLVLSGCIVSPSAVPTPESTQTAVASATISPTETPTDTAHPTPTAMALPTQTPQPPAPTPTPVLTSTSAIRNPLPDGEYMLLITRPAYTIQAVSRANRLSLLKMDVTNGFFGFSDFGNDLSPDGRLFAYVLSLKDGVRVVNLSTLATTLIQDSADCSRPAFAPDSQHLAVACYVGPERHREIHVIDLASGIHFKVFTPTDQERGVWALEWSPDGKTLAYLQRYFPVRHRSLDTIYLLNMGCFKKVQTCPDLQRIFAFATDYFELPLVWSPDSRNMLIMDGFETVRSINLDTGTSTDFAKMLQASASLVWVYNYAWSPDNHYIAFTGSRDDREFSQIISIYPGDPKSEMQDIVDSMGASGLYGWFKALEFKIGRRYTVTSIAADLALRDKPALDGKVIRPLKAKDTLTIVDGPINADYCTWWKMKIGDVEGWAQGIKYWFDAAK